MTIPCSHEQKSKFASSGVTRLDAIDTTSRTHDIKPDRFACDTSHSLVYIGTAKMVIFVLRLLYAGKKRF